jgi:membrane glycosyltransferase
MAEWALLAVFAPLYYQLNMGFWTALFGVWIMNRPKADPLDLWRTLSADDYRASDHGLHRDHHAHLQRGRDARL